MPWNPPVIVGSTFLDTESTDHKYKGKNAISRAAYDLDKGITFRRRIVSVDAVSLSHGRTVYGTSYTEHGHGSVASTASDRLRYVLDSGPVTLRWTLAGHAHVQRVEVEIYRPNTLAPVWTRAVDYVNGQPSAGGSLQFDPNTLVPEVFGDELSVYKLRVRVPPGSYRRATMSRWVYFVVEPPNWLKLTVKVRPGDAPLERVGVKLTPLGQSERVVTTDAQGTVSLRVIANDGNYSVAELVHDPPPRGEDVDEDEDEPLYMVTAVESA
ncbi:MAG: hypothetical protein R3A52_07680 [Polyangiales bacterium]